MITKTQREQDKIVANASQFGKTILGVYNGEKLEYKKWETINGDSGYSVESTIRGLHYCQWFCLKEPGKNVLERLKAKVEKTLNISPK